MPSAPTLTPNSLGDLRAEADRLMLDQAFLETADYRTLIETSDRPVVVGRRGTGKSALALRLQRFYARDRRTGVVLIAPEEHQTIGFRVQLQSFGSDFSKTRAAARLFWRYAFLMEATCVLAPTYKFKKAPAFATLQPRLDTWVGSGSDTLDRCLSTLRAVIPSDQNPEASIASLPALLSLTSVETAFQQAAEHATSSVVFLIDSLDEGYTPDPKGTGLIAGLLHAALDLRVPLLSHRLQ